MEHKIGDEYGSIACSPPSRRASILQANQEEIFGGKMASLKSKNLPTEFTSEPPMAMKLSLLPARKL